MPFSDTGKVTVNASGFYLPAEASGGSVSTAHTIDVINWAITDGFDGDRYTFGSTITGDGNIQLSVWKGGTATNVYNFSGNMTEYTGDIISIPSAGATSGGMILNFIGTSRDTVSGTGNISLGATAVTFNTTGGTSSVKNGSISAKGITFTGGTAESPSSYTVDSLLNLTAGALTIAANTSVTMTSGSSLTLAAGTTTSLSGSLIFDSGSTLDVLNGTTLTSSNLTFTKGMNISLDASTVTTALTLTGLTTAGSGTINLNVSAAEGFTSDSSYTLLEATSFDGFSTEDFNIILEGSTSTYDLNFVDNKLVMTILRGAQTLAWVGDGTGSGTWGTDTALTTWEGDEPDTYFANGDFVSFENTVMDTVNTITVQGEVAPAGAITVSGAGDTIIDTRVEGSSIIGAGNLVKNDAGTLALYGANSFSGGVTLNGGKLVIDTATSIGSGDLTINGGELRVEGFSPITLSGSKINVAADTVFAIDLANDLTISNAAGIGNHALSLTGTGTFTHDAWAQVSSLHLGEGVTFNSTQTNANSEVGKIITGTGTINIANASGNTTDWKFRLQYDSTDLFGGTINLAENGRAVILLDGTTAAEIEALGAAPARVNVNLGDDSQLVVGSLAAAEETFYISSLSGNGSMRFDWNPDDSSRNVDLQMSANNSYGGEFGHDGRMGDFIVSSVTGAHHTLTLTGIGQNDNGTGAKQILYIDNANVEMTQGATWNTGVNLLANDSQLIFNNNVAATREASAGAITGAGQVVIKSLHEDGVTINNANTYEGGTLIQSNAKLKLGHDDAAGTGKIQLNSGSELVLANGITVGNVIELLGNATLSTGTGESATVKGNISGSEAARSVQTLAIEGDITLSEMTVSTNLSVAAGSTLTLDGVSMSSTLNVDATGGTVNYMNIEMTGATTIDARKLPTFETSEETIEENVQAFTITGLNAGVIQNTKDSLTLDVTMTELDYGALIAAFENNELVVFELDGIQSFDEELWYRDITLSLTNGTDTFTYNALGVVYDDMGGDVMLYIPEPSTATLSLLALAGLLVRRRRQAA